MKFEEKLRQFLVGRYQHAGQAFEDLGISRVQLSIYLNGRGKPGFEVLRKLSKMGCDLNWLLNDEAEEPEAIEIKEEPEEKKSDRIIMKLVDIIHELVKKQNKVDQI